jgi:hypothetical protein
LATTTTSSTLIPPSTARSSSATPSNTHRVTHVTNSTLSSSGSHESSYSTGTLVGAIVGSVAGTFILTLLAFLYLRRRRKRDLPDGTIQTYVAQTTKTPKHPEQIRSRFLGVGPSISHENNTCIAPVDSPVSDLGSYIPPPADDDTVCIRIQTLFDQASLHIDNYYSHTNPTLRLTPDAVACMNPFESPFLPSPLATLLSNPRSQRIALTHALVRALLQAIRPGIKTSSLLPPSYTLGPQTRTYSNIDIGMLLALYPPFILT